MISLLNLINDNVLSLIGFVKDKGLLGDEEGKDKGKAKSDDETTTNITYSCLDHDVHRTQQQEAEENQMAYEATQVM